MSYRCIVRLHEHKRPAHKISTRKISSIFRMYCECVCKHMVATYIACVRSVVYRAYVHAYVCLSTCTYVYRNTRFTVCTQNSLSLLLSTLVDSIRRQLHCILQESSTKESNQTLRMYTNILRINSVASRTHAHIFIVRIERIVLV